MCGLAPGRHTPLLLPLPLPLPLLLLMMAVAVAVVALALPPMQSGGPGRELLPVQLLRLCVVLPASYYLFLLSPPAAQLLNCSTAA